MSNLCEKKRVTLHVRDARDNRIARAELEQFLAEFDDGRPLSLPKHLRKSWQQFADGDGGGHSQKIWLPARLRRGESKPRKPDRWRLQVPDRQGIYAIFGRKEGDRTARCFYVGISPSKVGKGSPSGLKDRVLTHINQDVYKNSRGVFRLLKEYDHILVCYALIEGDDHDKLKRKLELLEMCLTVELRPRFLYEDAKSQ